MFILWYLIIYFLLLGLSVAISKVFFSALMLFSLIVLIPSISLGTRRLHDTNMSGWWQLVALIPVIGPVILIVLFARPSADSVETEATASPIPPASPTV